MGLDIRYPGVEPLDPTHGDLALVDEDGQVVDHTGHANVSCFLPETLTDGSWYRFPPRPPERPFHWFVDATTSRVFHADYPVAHGHGFDYARFVLAELGSDMGWRPDRHPRYVADLTGDGKGDLVGFGDDGVWTALGDGAGGFAAAQLVLAAYAPNAGGWTPPDHPRFVADLTGDGRADIVGFGDDGVWTSLGNGGGGFSEPAFVLADFGPNAFGWRGERHPRFVTDLTGDGRADILGFGEEAVWVAPGDGGGGFQPTRLGCDGLGAAQGFTLETHLRLLADLTGDGRPDIVAFGDDGVWTALGDGAGGFSPPQFVLAEYGVAQGWTNATRPRLVADTTGDGRADLLGFREDGLVVARGNGAGGFEPPQLVLPFFGAATGHVAWDPWVHPRLTADLTGNGAADLLGFSEDGAWALVFDTAGPVGPQIVLFDLGSDQGWRPDLHLRVAADLTGDGRADIVGFGAAGVWVSRNLGEGPRPGRVASPAG